MWHSTHKQSEADLWRLPWGSFRHFPARAWHHREVWPEGTSSITGWDCCQRYAWIRLSWILPYRHSDCTVLPRHCGPITIQQCQPFWNAPHPPVTTRQHLKKKVSTSIFPKDDFFFSPSLWVGRGIPWKSTWSRHLRGLLEKNMSPEMDGGGEWGEFALC